MLLENGKEDVKYHYYDQVKIDFGRFFFFFFFFFFFN